MFSQQEDFTHWPVSSGIKRTTQAFYSFSINLVFYTFQNSRACNHWRKHYLRPLNSNSYRLPKLCAISVQRFSFPCYSPHKSGIPTGFTVNTVRSWFTNSFCISRISPENRTISVYLVRMHWIKKNLSFLKSENLYFALPSVKQVWGNPVLNWQLFLWDCLDILPLQAVVFAWSLLESPLLIYSLFLQRGSLLSLAALGGLSVSTVAHQFLSCIRVRIPSQ